VENLEWVSPSENSLHAVKIGVKPVGSKHSCSKLTEESVEAILALYDFDSKRFSHGVLSRIFNISERTIFNILHGKKWKHV
jgi:hypothetical protein